jgi:uncharacterized protein (TIGR03000 family)
MRALIGVFALGFGLFGNIPARAEEPAGNKEPVVIMMLVPAGAEVTFDGTKTQQTGAQRRFESPPIPTDKTYKYRIHVVTPEGELDVSRALSVRGGERITLDFRGGQVRETRGTGRAFFEPAGPVAPRYAPSAFPVYSPGVAPFSPANSPRNLPWAPNG